MKLRKLFGLVLLLVTLGIVGCAGMSTLQSSGGGASTMMGCNGDVPSHYGNGCRPSH